MEMGVVEWTRGPHKFLKPNQDAYLRTIPIEVTLRITLSQARAEELDPPKAQNSTPQDKSREVGDRKYPLDSTKMEVDQDQDQSRTGVRICLTYLRQKPHTTRWHDMGSRT